MATEYDDLFGDDYAADLVAIGGGSVDESVETVENPLAGVTGADLEETEANRVAAVGNALRNRTEAQYMHKRRSIEDSEHWFAVCFVTREDKEMFLRKFGLDSLGDKYLSGPDAEAILDDYYP